MSMPKELLEGLQAHRRGDYSAAFACFSPLAEQGDKDALYWLGHMFMFGQGIPVDQPRGTTLLRSAAIKGLGLAQDMLGTILADGVGVERNLTEAVIWFKKAADQGLPEAQYHLALCFEHGRGLDRNAREALRLYRAAAEQNFASAQCNAGAMYLRGGSIEQDSVLAYVYFRLAARSGNANAIANLCSIAWRLSRDQLAKGEEILNSWRAGVLLPEKSGSQPELGEINEVTLLALVAPMREIGRRMSLEDISNLRAIAEKKTGNRVTLADTPDGHLWTEFVKLGWAVELVVPAELARALPAARHFTPTDSGCDRILMVTNAIYGDWQERQLRDIGRGMSLGDISTTQAVAEKPGAFLATVANTPHGDLWAEFVKFGWAVEAPLPAELAQALPAARHFAATDAGRDRILMVANAIYVDWQERQQK